MNSSMINCLYFKKQNYYYFKIIYTDSWKVLPSRKISVTLMTVL